MIMMKYRKFYQHSKINNILIEKYKDLSKNPDFEQD